jgi:hypothetical protein
MPSMWINSGIAIWGPPMLIKNTDDWDARWQHNLRDRLLLENFIPQVDRFRNSPDEQSYGGSRTID